MVSAIPKAVSVSTVETLKRVMGLQNGHPLTTGVEDQGDGLSFLKEAFSVILEEVLLKGTNVQEKVLDSLRWPFIRLSVLTGSVMLAPGALSVFPEASLSPDSGGPCRSASGRTLQSCRLCWTWSCERGGRIGSSCWSVSRTWPDTASRPVRFHQSVAAHVWCSCDVDHLLRSGCTHIRQLVFCLSRFDPWIPVNLTGSIAAYCAWPTLRGRPGHSSAGLGHSIHLAWPLTVPENRRLAGG